MRILYCWRCGCEMPMLDEAEFRAVFVAKARDDAAFFKRPVQEDSGPNCLNRSHATRAHFRTRMEAGSREIFYQCCSECDCLNLQVPEPATPPAELESEPDAAWEAQIRWMETCYPPHGEQVRANHGRSRLQSLLDRSPSHIVIWTSLRRMRQTAADTEGTAVRLLHAPGQHPQFPRLRPGALSVRDAQSTILTGSISSRDVGMPLSRLK